MKKGLTFDDIMLIPSYTEVSSRSECSTKTLLFGRSLDHPVVPANMDTITEQAMLAAIFNTGGIAFIHRFMSIKDQFNMVKHALLSDYQFAIEWNESPAFIPFTIGMKENLPDVWNTLAPLVYHYGEDQAVVRTINCLLLDVAHANSKQVVDRINEIRVQYAGPLIVGNVATYDGVRRLIDAGVDGVKVGIGNGSICSTRLVTGHGVPQVTALQEADRARSHAGLGYSDFAIISDGGCNYYGDVVKALSLGANLVMTGKLFAGCTETPGMMINNSQGIPSKLYRGMASWEAQNERQFSGKTAEGVSHVVPIKGSAVNIVSDIQGAIRSALSYSGVTTIEDMYRNAEFIVQTSSGINESQTRR